MAGSRRTEPLPSDWAETRVRIADRDNHVCQLGYSNCTILGTQVDHIIPSSVQRIESDQNLQLVCGNCHSKKTAREANNSKPKRKRPKDSRHPGLIN